MFESIKKMFSAVKTDYAQLMSEGAVILDVRSHGEYVSGHIEGSVNIPVNKQTYYYLLRLRNAKCICKGIIGIKRLRKSDQWGFMAKSGEKIK
jgi:3-mercaptopyruvate sulfurtransferase SseA